MCVQTGLVFVTCAAFLDSSTCLHMIEGGSMHDHAGALAAASVATASTGK